MTSTFRTSGSTRSVFCFLLLGFLSYSSASQDNTAVVHHVSGNLPVQGPHREFAADLPADSGNHAAPTLSSAFPANPWRLQAIIPAATVHDLSFPTATVGFAAAEGGQVWKTMDSGATWNEVLSLGFPYEWYGVHALNANDVIVSGFLDSNFENGIIRWSHDGGATWTADIQVSTTSWSYRSGFASPTQGLILDLSSTAHYTTDGGAATADWNAVSPVSDGSWFGSEFSLLPDQHTTAAGIHYCTSANAGQTWTCAHSVDNVFDGGVFFADDNNGWVGGGEIAPNVEGWIHRTTDGGKTWSGRVLDGPFPIREIFFVSSTMGWAAGGNVFSNVGGIYFSADGGQTWSLDLDTNGHEMLACDSQPAGGAYQVWCVGPSETESVVYTVQGASTPAFSPAPGSYSAAQAVSLSTATPNAVLYYTTNGSTPTASSPAYSNPIAVSATTTIQAIAVAPGTAPSLSASGLYTVTPPQLQLAGNSPAVTVKAGSSASVQLSLQASQSTPNVTFSCTGLPSGAQCSFSPVSATATTVPTAVTLTIATSSSAAARSAVTVRRAGLPIGLAVIFPWFLLLPGSALCARRRYRGLWAALSLAVVIGLAGCGGSPVQSQQPVSATITVTASAAGATSSSTQVQLTINP